MKSWRHVRLMETSALVGVVGNASLMMVCRRAAATHNAVSPPVSSSLSSAGSSSSPRGNTDVRVTRTTAATASSPASSQRVAGGDGRGSTPWKRTVRRARPTTTITAQSKEPWGMQQLRDSWSEDAMAKQESYSLGGRIMREYRYHPLERTRLRIKHMAAGLFAVLIIIVNVVYYYCAGHPLWKGDPQHLLNLFRQSTISPRSKFYTNAMDEQSELPAHIVAYRAKHHERRVEQDLLFDVTSSAFVRPHTEEVVRRLELRKTEDEEQLRELERAVYC